MIIRVYQQYEYGYTNNGSLMISSLQPYDNGEYMCMAVNEYGNDTVDVYIDTQGISLSSNF